MLGYYYWNEWIIEWSSQTGGFYRDGQSGKITVDDYGARTGKSPGMMRQLNINGALYVGKWPWHLTNPELYQCSFLLVLLLSCGVFPKLCTSLISQIFGNQEGLQRVHSSTFWTSDSWLRGQDALRCICAVDWPARKNPAILVYSTGTC